MAEVKPEPWMDDDLLAELGDLNDLGGRPTKLDDKFTKTFCNLLRIGCYIETACRLAGISRSTFYGWMKRGKDETDRLMENRRAKPRKKEAPYREFSDRVMQALAVAEMEHVGTVYKASVTNRDPRVALAWLKIRYGGRYRDAVEVTGPGGGPVQAVNFEAALDNLSDEDLDTLDRIASKMRGVPSLEEEIAATYEGGETDD